MIRLRAWLGWGKGDSLLRTSCCSRTLSMNIRCREHASPSWLLQNGKGALSLFRQLWGLVGCAMKDDHCAHRVPRSLAWPALKLNNRLHQTNPWFCIGRLAKHKLLLLATQKLRISLVCNSIWSLLPVKRDYEHDAPSCGTLAGEGRHWQHLSVGAGLSAPTFLFVMSKTKSYDLYDLKLKQRPILANEPWIH
eukprot:1689788-Pleurochrysis_carterae.AAC.5